MTNNHPADDSLGRDVVAVPQTLTCNPDGFAYGKRMIKKSNECDIGEDTVCDHNEVAIPLWQKDMDWILAALKEGGFDQHFFYK